MIAITIGGWCGKSDENLVLQGWREIGATGGSRDVS